MSLYDEGFRYFISGMAEGSDLLAAKEVISLQSIFPDIRLICAIPFPRQSNQHDYYWKEMYNTVLAKSDFRILISQKYYDGVFLKRNDFMLVHSSCLVYYYDGQQRSGT